MTLLDLIFPTKCVNCGKKGKYFCDACVSKVSLNKQICLICERPSVFGQTHSLCKNKSNIGGVYSFFEYKEIIRKAIIEFKFKYVTDLEESFWKRIFSEIERRRQDFFLIDKFLKEKKPVIIPVPLYWYKQNLRGFNQSCAFGKRLSDLYKLPFSEKIVIRASNTKPQAKLTQTQRKENLKGVFEKNNNVNTSGNNFVIFDDILTTGSTIKEINKVLKENNAGEVWGMTIAR